MKFIRGLFSFIAFLLCIVLFVSSVVTMLVADVRVITSKDNLKTIINHFITGSMSTAPNPAGLAAGTVILRAEEEEEGSALMDSLVKGVYEMLAQQYGDNVPFTEEDVSGFVKESTLPEFISEKAADIITDIYNGELTTTITGEEVKELIEENKTLIEDTLDIKLSDEMVNTVTSWVEKSDITTKVQEKVAEMVGIPVAPAPEVPEVSSPDGSVPGETGSPDVGSGNEGAGKPSLNAPSSGKHESEGGIVGDVTAAISDIKGLITAMQSGQKLSLPIVLNILRSVTTKNVLIACIGVCLVLMLLIFLFKLNHWYAALRNCGVVYLLAGLLMLLPVGAAQLLPMLLGNNPTIPLIRLVVNMTVTVSGSVAIGGLVLIITGSLSGSIVRRHQRKKAEQAMQAAATNAAAYVPVPTYIPDIPVVEPVVETFDTPVADPVVEVAEEPAEAPAEEIAEEPATEVAAEAAEEAAEETVENAAEAAEETVENAAEAAEETAENTAEEAAEETAEV